MKIVALIKCWSGEEFLEPSVESIINHVEKVVLLYSEVSWIGGTGNPSAAVIANLKKKYPNKIVVLRHDESNQLKHCDYGYKYIQSHFDCDYVQLIDSDEPWDDTDYIKAKEFLARNPGYKAYRTQMYTYIKSPFYRVDPIEPLKPVCFIRPDLPNMGTEARACTIEPFAVMPDVYCHHFVFVRSHVNKVFEKLIQSHVSEKQPYEPLPTWITEVWNKLPDYNRQRFPNGFHPAIGFGHNWKNLKVVEKDDLPKIFGKYGYVYNFGN